VPESPQNVIKTSIDTAAAPLAKLQPDAISGTQDVIIGMASSAPAASIGLTIAALAATTAYGSGAIILFTAIPMLVIANAYRRLNLWNANCGASFEWVGRAINPYLGFLTGWLMIAAYVIATVSGVEVLGPTVLAVFGADSASTWADIAIGTGVGVIMLVIAVIGIKVTARTQVGMAFIEYTLLIGFGIAGLVMVLLHRHGTVPLSRGWLSFSGIGGKGSAAVIALGVIYTPCTAGLQGTVPAKALQDNAASALVYTAQAIGGRGWAKAMAFALALSVVATTGTWVYLLATSVQEAFTDVVDVTGLLFAIFYALTALATIAYYRRRIFSSPADAITLGILPLGAVAFLAWVLDQTLRVAPAAQVWSLTGITGTGVVVMLILRLAINPQFFRLPRESDASRH